jgi:hypothetical protein
MKKLIKDNIGIIMIFLIPFTGLAIMGYVDSKRPMYEEGWHMDYTIKYEQGFVYKVLPGKQGTILVLNQDGTPMKTSQVK